MTNTHHDKLPNGVDEIMEHIGRWAAGYDTGLKWNEIAKLKADMMNAPRRWEVITLEQLEQKCRNVGLNNEDTHQVVTLLRKRKQGRRLVPQQSYKDFKFTFDITESPKVERPQAAHDW